MSTYNDKYVNGKAFSQGLQGIYTKVKGKIVDNLTTSDATSMLSANQGKVLNDTKLGKSEKANSSLVADKLANARNISVTGAVTGNVDFDGSKAVTINTTLSNLDASKITSGTIDIARLPKGAIERLTIVQNDTARFQLTSATVQNGDTVKVTETKKMYFVKDDSQLSSEKGYEEYTVGKATAVEWNGIEGKPESFPPSAHNQASNTINAMTGYLKTGSGAIGTGDTLNQAIGKLEVGLDGKEPKISKQDGFNLPKSDSVSEANSNKLATSQAVKTAYDKGVEALNKANSNSGSLNNKLDKGGYGGNAQNLKSEIDGKVSKSGDTMIGILASSAINQFKSSLNSGGNQGSDLNSLLSSDTGHWGYMRVSRSNSQNLFPAENNANGVLTFNTHAGNYGHQLGFSSDGNFYKRYRNGGEFTSWAKVWTSDNFNVDTKLDKGSYVGTAQNLKELIDTKLDKNGKANSCVTADRATTSTTATTSNSCTGNSATATKLQTARTINGISFDGTQNITITANPNSHDHNSSYYTKSETYTRGEIDSRVNAKLNTSGGTINGSLVVTGTITSNNEVTAYSDIRLKENIKPIENALDKVLELNGYTFKMKGNTERSCGVIAQEVEKVLPEVIRETDEGYLSVAYANMVGLLIEAIKELKDEINELRGGK